VSRTRCGYMHAELPILKDGITPPWTALLPPTWKLLNARAWVTPVWSLLRTSIHGVHRVYARCPSVGSSASGSKSCVLGGLPIAHTDLRSRRSAFFPLLVLFLSPRTLPASSACRSIKLTLPSSYPGRPLVFDFRKGRAVCFSGFGHDYCFHTSIVSVVVVSWRQQ